MDKFYLRVWKHGDFLFSMFQYMDIEKYPCIETRKCHNCHVSIHGDRISDFLSTDFDDSNRYEAVTSGSTGTPFKVFHDKNKKNRNSADTIYFAKRAGFSVGDKLIYLKIWSENNKKALYNVGCRIYSH
jgi:phenylacetate-CoA ligase